MSYSTKVTASLAEGAKAFSEKDYEKAVEVYGEACGVFSAENGDDDADLLYLYGKSLYELAVSNSEVLGGAKGGAKTEEKKEEDIKEGQRFQFDEGVVNEEEEEEEEENHKEGKQNIEEEEEKVENDEDEGEEKEENVTGEAEEEDETDFEAAWNILDLARALFQKQLEAKEEQEEGEKEHETANLDDNETPENKQLLLKKKLSDCYDILGEVSLEAENYYQASKDFEQSLELRKQLFKPYSALISESYYKLSLAYEFQVDIPGTRDKAAKCVELSIEAAEKNPNTKADSEVVAELKDRLEDLKKDYLKEEKEKIMKGLLGEVMEEAMKNDTKTQDPKPAAVNDLTSMVKKRKGPKVMGSSKRKKSGSGK